MKAFAILAVIFFVVWVLLVFTAGIPREHVAECVRLAGAIPIYGRCH